MICVIGVVGELFILLNTFIVLKDGFGYGNASVPFFLAFEGSHKSLGLM